MGVTDLVADAVAVMSPLLLTEIDGLAVTVVAGVDALPLETLFDAADD